jgi:hypothetical protein
VPSQSLKNVLTFALGGFVVWWFGSLVLSRLERLTRVLREVLRV